MAIFCDKTGVRLSPPTGDAVADVAAFKDAASKRVAAALEALAAVKADDPNRAKLEAELAAAGSLLRPVSVDVDAEFGWKVELPPPPPKPAPEPKTTAAPSVERAPQPAAAAAQEPRRGSR